MTEEYGWIPLDGRNIHIDNLLLNNYHIEARNFILICEKIMGNNTDGMAYLVRGFFTTITRADTTYTPDYSVLNKMANKEFYELKSSIMDCREDYPISMLKYEWISKCCASLPNSKKIIEINSSTLYDQDDGMTYVFHNKALAEKYRKLVNESRGFTNG